MPTRHSSSNSAGAVYLDKQQRVEELRAAAQRAAARHPAIRRAVLFGSLVSGIPTPRSDADVMIIVAASSHENARDRIPSMLAALGPLPCAIDLLVLTENELAIAQERGDPLVREALANGMELAGAA